jgi:hypothetical protein
MFLAANPLKEIEIAHILGQVNRCGYLAIIEYRPPLVLENMSDIVPTVGGCAHMAHKCHQLVSCKQNIVMENKS